MLAASESTFGFLPSPVAKAAHAPVLLKQLLAGFGAFEQTSLTPLEREVVAMTVGFENDCHYCMALHSALLSRSDGHKELVENLRAGAPLHDQKLETLRQLVLTLLRDGRVSERQWAQLKEASFTEAKVLEVMLGTAVYWLSTRANVLTEAQLDAPFEAFRWNKPSAR